jgi:hypothetical protein
MSYDPKCLELAEYFLPTMATDCLKNDLAQAVQDAVEDWLSLTEDHRVHKFSDGSDATLGTLAKWAPLFGPQAEAYVAAKIAASPLGANEEVIADESQILLLFASMMGDGE